jgi:hypothetical protein
MRGRLLVCAAVVVALTAGLLPRSLGGARPAGALDPSDCTQYVEGSDPQVRTLFANDDGAPTVVYPTKTYPYSTKWNVPLNVPEPGVLANDEDGIGDPDDHVGLQAILWHQAQYGTVTLNRDGAFTYTPRLPRTPTLPVVIDTFQYIGYQSQNGTCTGLPAAVTIQVGGFGETVGQAPSGNPDKYPDDEAMSAADVLTIPAPGVLANDYNGVSFQANDNLQAILVSDPVVAASGALAGTITDWGVEEVEGVPVADNSGGFKFTPFQHFDGTVEFKYKACYVDRPTTATACSDPIKVSIEIAPTFLARPVTMFVDSFGGVVINADALRDATVWSQPFVNYLWFSDPSHGTLTRFSRGLIYQAGESFTGQDQAEYWFCDTPGPPTAPAPQICTNHAALNLVAAADTPHVTAVDFPDAANKPLIVHFSDQVRGITTDNVTIFDASGSLPTAVPAQVLCRSTFLPGSFVDCGVNADSAEITPTNPFTEGHDYYLLINQDVKGIVAAAPPNPSLLPYRTSFRADFVPEDASAPVASPTQSPAANAAGWNNSDVTIDWHWSDGSGSGIDSAHCKASSTSTGQGAPLTLTATCTDRAGNVGSASYDVKVDKTRTIAAPTPSPAANAAGWNNGNVSVDWNWSDGTGSGIDPAHCQTSSTSSGEGAPLLLASVCTDVAGNSALATYTFYVDKTAPVATPTASPAANAAGWNKSDVTVAWNWSDGFGSGIDPALCPETSNASGPGLTIVGATCTDVAGNTRSASYALLIDKDAPVASPTLSQAANASGWNNDDVTIDWHWSDGTGSGIDPTHCTETSSPIADGRFIVTASCTDLAGNTTIASQELKIDVDGPVASPIQSPAANAFGWNNSDVTVDWHWSDGSGSGIDPTHCTTTSRSSGQGIEVEVSATCTDIAGSTSTATYDVKVDKVAPIASPTQSPSANADGWNKTDVAVTWHWHDGSGSGTDSALCTTTSNSVGQGASIVVNATCTDNAGNTGSASRTVKVDKTAPSLAPTISPNPVLLGSAASANPHATDSTSGVASSFCGPIDTSTVGAKTVQCTATDVAGNVKTVSVPYVVGFGIANLAPPSRSKFKAGANIPMKFQLTGANGQPIAASLAQSLPACAAKVTIGTQPTVCAVFDARTNTFQANVKAPANTPVGTELPIRVAVTIGTTTVATASTSIVITK